ncbi:MAG: lamin tail domain-containing protein [Nitrosopumilaceae archaeon]
MNSSILIGLFAALLLGGAVYPSFSQSSSIADYVVINEIDINPPGDDSRSVSEWVELYNPTDDEINLGGWTISSTTVLKKTLTIPSGTILEPGRFLAYSHVKVWFTDVSERVELRDSNGILVDETPEISDLKSDFTSWQRIYDGLDTDSSSDWKFESSNAGSSNGKLTQEEVVEKALVTVSVDKANYVFGETAIISGEVSERVFQEIPFFQAAKIKIEISKVKTRK